MRNHKVRQFATWLLMVASLVGWIGGFGYLAYFGKWLIAACAFAGGLVGFLTALRWMLDEANGTHDND